MAQEKPISELLNFSIINIDKPSGPTSFTISDYVRGQIGLKKTSHFGTLDPKVTGVLPIALGRACKLTGFFLGHDKEYIGIMHTHKEQDIKKLQEIINKNFIGDIVQMPPIKSRVKRAERIREIKRFELLEQDENKTLLSVPKKSECRGKDFLFLSEVEGGTYIRKLIHDLGEEIGGAHMLELRRIRAGIFKEETCVSLYEFREAVNEYKKGAPLGVHQGGARTSPRPLKKGGSEDKLRKMLVSGEDAIKQIMPIVQIKKSAVKQLLTGKPLFKKDIIGNLPKEEVFAVFSGEQFVEIAEKTDKKGKEIFGRALFVFN